MHLEKTVVTMRRRVAPEKLGKTAKGFVVDVTLRITLIVNASNVNIRNCLNR